MIEAIHPSELSSSTSIISSSGFYTNLLDSNNSADPNSNDEVLSLANELKQLINDAFLSLAAPAQDLPLSTLGEASNSGKENAQNATESRPKTTASSIADDDAIVSVPRTSSTEDVMNANRLSDNAANRSDAGVPARQPSKQVIPQDILTTVEQALKENITARTWNEYLKETFPALYTSNEDVSPQLTSLRERVNRADSDLENYVTSFTEFRTWFENPGESFQQDLDKLSAKKRQRTISEYTRLEPKIQGLVEEFSKQVENFNSFKGKLDNDGAEYSQIQAEYRKLYKEANKFRNELLDTRKKLLQVSWNSVYKKFSNHANAWYGIVLVSAIIAAVNAIYPSIKEGKPDWGAFIGGFAAGIAGNFVLAKIKYFPENAILQTVFGQTLVIGVGQGVSSIEGTLQTQKNN